MDQQKLAEILCKVPNGVFNLLYLGRRLKKDGQLLNTKAQFLCKVVDKQTIPIEQDSLENMRNQIENLSVTLGGDDIPIHHVEIFSIPGPGGDIPVRLYKTKSASEKQPVLIAFHGGGFVRGSLKSHDGMFRRLAKFGDFAVLSVDYRLAPEHAYPAAADDAYAALKWVQENGHSKGLDQYKIAIGGDSSGGNLAAVATQDALKNGTPCPLFQLLIYPTTNSNFDTKSHEIFANGFFLTNERMCWYRDNYLQGDEKRSEVRASPGLNPDLAGSPPTLVMTAGFDPLRDEAEEYAQALKDAGVPMGVIRYEGMVHGFMSLSGLFDEADKALKTAADAVANAFANA
jgi:acetyl esterase/lipase